MLLTWLSSLQVKLAHAFAGEATGETVYRLSEAIGVCPSTVQSRLDGAMWDAYYCRPFADSGCASVVGYQSDHAPISTLLKRRSPSAIARLIVAIVVDTVKRCAGGPWSHVGIERAEVVSPSVAHRDASATVVMVVSVGLGKTTAFSPRPRIVLDRVRAAMRRELGALFLKPEASATRCITCRQVTICNGHDVATVASAVVTLKTGDLWGWLNHGKSSIASASRDRFMVSHAANDTAETPMFSMEYC